MLKKILRVLQRRLNVGYRYEKLYHGKWGYFFSSQVNSRVTGEYEQPKAQKLLELVSQGAVFMDIGAADGYFSIIAGTHGCDVIAFEPTPEQFKKLRLNLHANAIDATLSRAPVTNVVENQKFVINQHLGKSHLATHSISGDKEIRDVLTETVDHYCKKNNVTPDIIKIDVEGVENQVLEGMRKTIERASPVILLDTHPTRGFDEAALDEFLTEVGYEKRLIAESKQDFLLRRA